MWNNLPPPVSPVCETASGALDPITLLVQRDTNHHPPSHFGYVIEHDYVEVSRQWTDDVLVPLRLIQRYMLSIYFHLDPNFASFEKRVGGGLMRASRGRGQGRAKPGAANP
jgi:hypothetical protein